VAFLISDIKNSNPQNEVMYLFDANVWLAILEGFYNERMYNSYITFFDKIITNRIAPSAMIGMPSLLISEIINRIMKDIYYYNYCADSNLNFNTPGQYKRIYRESKEYVLDFENVCSNIRDYDKKITFISDDLNLYTCDDIIKNIPQHLDFNDYVYCKIASKKNIAIVTNDKDFKVEDIRILTIQKSLLDLNTFKK